MAVQQLRYTWSARGLEGVSQFQVTGASPGFRDPTSLEWGWASELCSYPGLPRSENADEWPSVGWITLRDGRRIVFHRVDAGLDGAGRRGNFAAHILMGPQEELPTSQGALLLTGQLWWTGSVATPLHLPTLTLDGLEEPRFCGDDDPELRTALALLLDSRGTASGFARTPALAARALSVLCDVAPYLLEARSISTFESPEEARSFQLVGTVAGHASVGSPSVTADTVASYLLHSPDARARTRTMLERSPAPWESVITTLLPFALRASGELAWAQMSRVSRLFDVAVELCLFPEGRAALCAGLEEGSPDALELFARLMSDTDPELIRLLGQDATCAAARVRSHEVMAILDRAGFSARQGAADAVEESAEQLEDDTFTTVLPLGVLAELLNRHTLPLESPRRRAWAVRSATLLRSQRRAPNFGRGWFELLAVLCEEQAWPTIAMLIEESDLAAPAAVQCLDVEGWSLVFRSIQASALPVVAASIHRAGIQQEAWAGAFWTAIGTCGNDAGWSTLEKIGGSVPVPGLRHEQVALGFLESRAKTETRDPSSSLILARAAPSLGCCVNQHLALWGFLAKNDLNATPAADELWLLEWCPELRMHAQWGVMRRIAALSDPRPLARWAHETLIASGTHPADEARFLVATAKRCRDGGHRTGVAAVLLTMAHLVEDGGLPVNRLNGRLKDQSTQEFWRSVARRFRLSNSDVADIAEQNFGRSTRAWLGSVLMDDPVPPARTTWASRDPA